MQRDTSLGGAAVSYNVEVRAPASLCCSLLLMQSAGCQSARSASTGSTRTARLAGSQAAAWRSVPLAIPRDRDGSFAPQLIPKGARRLPRFDQNVLSLFARGMGVSEIQEQLEELYQVAVAPDLISTITDEVLAEVTAWQQRPLDPCYPVVIFDALRVKVLTELHSRGVRDLLIALVDGLTGFPDAIHAVSPHTQIHTCVVHLVRRRLAFVSYKDRKRIASALRGIYRTDTPTAAAAALPRRSSSSTSRSATSENAGTRPPTGTPRSPTLPSSFPSALSRILGRSF